MLKTKAEERLTRKREQSRSETREIWNRHRRSTFPSFSSSVDVTHLKLRDYRDHTCASTCAVSLCMGCTNEGGASRYTRSASTPFSSLPRLFFLLRRCFHRGPLVKSTFKHQQGLLIRIEKMGRVQAFYNTENGQKLGRSGGEEEQSLRKNMHQNRPF